MIKTIINNDLTCVEVVELRMSLFANIAQIEKLLQASVDLKIEQNISYYSERINMMKQLQEKMKKLKEVPGKAPKNVTNALFVGSTAELQKMLKKKKDE